MCAVLGLAAGEGRLGPSRRLQGSALYARRLPLAVDKDPEDMLRDQTNPVFSQPFAHSF